MTNLTEIITQWIEEVDVPYLMPEDPVEQGKIHGRNDQIVLLRSKIPDLIEKIEKNYEDNK